MIGSILGYNDSQYNLQSYNNSSVDEKEISQADIKQMKRTGKLDCETCKNRKYVDGSNDSGVSFKTPTNISPSASSSKVYSHEREHFSRENAKAQRENKEVISNTISVSKAICPECGQSYTSGGQTRTVTKTTDEKEDDRRYFTEQFYKNTVGKYFGNEIDMKV